MNTITVTVDHGTYEMTVDADGWPVEPCSRCYGTGHYSFNGYDSVCYLCGNREAQRWVYAVTGAGSVAQAQTDYCAVLRRRLQQRGYRDAARERKAAAARAERDAKRAALADRFDAFPLAVDATYYENFVAAGADLRAIRGYMFVADRWADGRTLSDRMLEIAGETTAKLAAAGSLAPLQPGRQTLAGVVRSVKPVEHAYGTTWKAVVELESGHRVYGALAAAISHAQAGDRVEFAAAVELTDDPSFAWFSRPTKARMVDA